MILKLSKTLNDKKGFTLLSFTMNNYIDGVTPDKFNDADCNIYEDNINYYYYIENIIDLGECEKFKIKVKKGDIVSLTARDNSYVIFPSKKSFAYAFNLNYNKVLCYKYDTVLIDEKPYEVKYVEDNDEKINDGVVYTLAQLVSYISTLIKSYTYRKAQNLKTKKSEEIINRVIMKYYSGQKMETNRLYELNVKKVGLDKNNKWFSGTIVNVSNSNKYLYDYYLLRMFSYMILTKSQSDIKNNNDLIYRFDREFKTIEEVYAYLEENQDIVNNFFIETELMFNKPNEMYTSYAPVMNGIYMFYDYNNVKTYLYRSIDEQYFNEKSLKMTYVSKGYKHKIKGIKINYSI